MILRPPGSPRTAQLCPDTTLFRSVGPDDEHALSAGHQQTLDRTVLLQCSTGFAEFGDGARVKLVDRFTLAVETQLGETVRQLVDLDGLPLVQGRIGHYKHLAHRWKMRRSEEHTSELQSLMRISYAVFCLKKKKI